MTDKWVLTWARAALFTICHTNSARLRERLEFDSEKKLSISQWIWTIRSDKRPADDRTDVCHSKVGTRGPKPRASAPLSSPRGPTQ